MKSTSTSQGNRMRYKAGAALILPLFTSALTADLTDLLDSYSSELERNAAIANQATYDQLKSSGCTDSQRVATASCSGLTFVSWNAVREVVHTANELTGNGPTEFSLGLDLEGLGFTLRWTAGEEFSTQGNLANRFLSGQLTGLANRISSIRYGVGGIASNLLNNEGILIAASELNGKRGGAAGDSVGQWSPWGSFLNANYLYGDRAPTEREAAYDFDGYDVNAGVDYRFENGNVFGVLVGYQNERVDFDSTQSIVDGDVETDGYSTQFFYLMQGEQAYANISVGFQDMTVDMERVISYPSLNPNIPSTNTTAISETDVTSTTLFFSTGYTFNPTAKFSIEPYLSLDYRDITIDGFSETDINNDGFDFVVAEQEIKSFETTVGLKVHYVFTTSLGVFVPYIDAQQKEQLEDDERIISAYYLNAEAGLSDIEAASFQLPVDLPDTSYQVYTIGLSMILRGASQATDGGAAAGGISAYFNYRTFEGIEFFTQTQIQAGFRYEF